MPCWFLYDLLVKSVNEMIVMSKFLKEFLLYIVTKNSNLSSTSYNKQQQKTIWIIKSHCLQKTCCHNMLLGLHVQMIF